MEPLKVIIVDDDSDDQELFFHGLEAGHRFKVTGCASGYKQLTYLLEMQADDLPDVILLDVNVPGKNGIEICNELTKDIKYKKIAFVLMSEIPPLPAIERSIQTNVTAFFVKPCTMEEFRVFAIKLHELVLSNKRLKTPGKLLEIVTLLAAV